MKNRKKHLLFTLFALGILAAGGNGRFPEKETASIANAAETGFIIDDDGILAKYTGTDTSIVIPDGVTGIGDRAFYNKNNLTSIIIPDSVTTIGSKAFWGCKSLTEITIPETVVSIGRGTFKKCNSLTEITIPGNIKTIEGDMFYGCKNLKKIVLPDSITDIEASAFSGCRNLVDVVLPKNLVNIGNSAFLDCKSLTEIIIPQNVVSVGGAVFLGCKKLAAVTIPEKTETLGNNIFNSCTALKKIEVKKGNKEYKSEDGVLFKQVKSGMELITYPAAKKGKTYKVPAKTSSIGYNAFEGCKKLTGLVISGNLKKVEYRNGSFFNFAGLKNIKVRMKKGQKINMSFVIDLDSDAGPAIPEVAVKNKGIARVSMPSDWEDKNRGDIDYIVPYTLKGSVKAKKKGKAEIIFKREVASHKKINDKEFELENITLKTTVEIIVK
ncbi:MAG: leucine-rich repeat domain-containing protein [Lachnospiraceae bacterium]|nr:leucine-rich repeat domain-containing protein [Lachnospiraceae bacterium]